MMSHRSWFGLVGSAALLMGCGAGTDDPDGPPGYMGAFNNPGASNGAGGAPPVGGAGTTSNPVSNGQGGTNGLTPTGAGGNTPTGGAGEGNVNVNPINPGGAGTGNNNSGGAGQAGSGNTGGGSFVSVPVNGGASAAFVCPDGATFGNPLTGMGQVQTVNVPQSSFLEGPVWVGSQNRLFFSDNASNPERIWSMVAPFTTPTEFMPNSGSNGLAVDNEDQLLLADEAVRRITRVSSTSPPELLEEIALTGQPTPNDLILRSDENLYFTDPNRGFYRRSPGGQLTGPITRANVPNAPGNPNGILLSPDENTLYVSDVFGRSVSSFSLLADGTVDVATAEVFVDDTGNLADGMAVDCAGNLYVGTETGVEVYTANGDPIGDLPTGYSSNVTFGGADRRTLFVTSRSELKFVTLGVPGLPD